MITSSRQTHFIHAGEPKWRDVVMETVEMSRNWLHLTRTCVLRRTLLFNCTASLCSIMLICPFYNKDTWICFKSSFDPENLAVAPAQTSDTICSVWPLLRLKKHCRWKTQHRQSVNMCQIVFATVWHSCLDGNPLEPVKDPWGSPNKSLLPYFLLLQLD